MGKLRRTKIIAGALLAACCTWAAEGQVSVENGARPGQFGVVNHGPGPVDLLRKVTVEQLETGKWVVTEAEVFLIGNCREKAEVSSVRLTSGQKLTVAPWNGKTCDGQCARSCRANIYLGPGEFRFVLWTADHQTRFEGPSFRLK
jgi:hypothetical protein